MFQSPVSRHILAGWSDSRQQSQAPQRPQDRAPQGQDLLFRRLQPRGGRGRPRPGGGRLLAGQQTPLQGNSLPVDFIHLCFHFQELWELNLTTRRWTKSLMKGEIPEQLVG